MPGNWVSRSRSACSRSVTRRCSTSAQGTAEEQLTRMATAASTVGSRIVRCVLGSSADRSGAVPIESHIEDTVKVLRNVRSRIMDAGLKVAIESRPGDMQAREVKMLIEEAGKEFVGSCLDSGNPLGLSGPAPDAGDAVTLRADRPRARYRRLEYAAGRRSGLDTHGRRQRWHRGLHSRVRRQVSRPPVVTGDHRHRAASVQLPRSEILGCLIADSHLGVRALSGAGGKRQAARGASEAFSRGGHHTEVRRRRRSVKWTKAFLATL